ncbi:MAG: hypothetical protein QOH81_1101 [Sphingomonadales bacterium]|jgi:hypothetical protein|nr:hypothetical protein [Sphingomonadales bacterium]
MFSLKRRRIQREREQASAERVEVAKAFVAAIREAEEALVAIKAANDKFYRSDRPAEQATLSSLRRERERLFVFHTVHELVAEAPTLARLLELRASVSGAMPLVGFIEHTNNLDLSTVNSA